MTFLEELLQDFQKMLEFRTSVGYATATYISSITPFIYFCGENYPEASCITKQMIDAWLAYYPYKKSQTQAVFISLLRQYTKFICLLGKESFIPDSDYTVHRKQYLPYVFSDTELTCFFDSADKIPTRNKKFQRGIVLPVLFRMMYCCGMRPSEPLRLRCVDVELKTGDIYIRQTKKNKDRHIIMSKDLLSLCQKYDGIVGLREWFFQRTDGVPYDTEWMTKHFHICWDRSGLIKRWNPRPYDLRHAFASRNIIRWIDEGQDVMSLIPYLSTYMGHSEFRDTLYYVHILPERLRNSAGIDWSKFDVIFKEDESDEKS
jgi:integrase/recombinase XerD